MEDISITLTTKPGASLKASVFSPPSPTTDNSLSDVLVVFLNGLVLSRRAWSPAITYLLSRYSNNNNQQPPTILTYDRYGQGDSDNDPTDDPSALPYGHDAYQVVSDLHQLLTQFIASSSCLSNLNSTRLVFICSSIGCPLARLYANAHAHQIQISAYLFLDSMIANTDFVSIFPDPDDPQFDPDSLPADISLQDLRYTRSQFYKFFHPTVPNAEHLDRRRLAEMLPFSDEPLLPLAAVPGSGSNDKKSPLLTVVGHDWDEFAEQCEKGTMTVPKRAINAFMNPAWASYNDGLAHLIQPPENQTPVKIATGCGHFIQKDDPEFVAREIKHLLDNLQG
ncbi:Alpha/Beta hydrolase protein [Apiosordaria backusii]|uniref:Alpha/Beta hydrolase protein n=1 Tax=Apiosordaria backusii TaxID=314023 RepID=A0AA40ANH0_9PEZI|nr:Alpha/Beta hydrolase protein [Apiosordaria backusii]